MHERRAGPPQASSLPPGGTGRRPKGAPMSDLILIVEDEPKLAALVRDYLQAAGYRSEWLADGRLALERLKTGPMPAAVLLDVMLPGLDGLEVCRAVRAFSDVPILINSARVEELDRLLGLELGADDYVC